MAFFERTIEGFAPLPHAASQWSAHAINGAAVAGLGAYGIESEHGGPGLVPARFTIDLFRQPKFGPLSVRTRQVRDGRTVRIADAWVEQGGVPVARATAVLVRLTAQPAGTRWQPRASPEYPRPQDISTPSEPAIHWGSDAHPEGWSTVMSEHQNASRKRLWIYQADLFAGEPSSPFVRAASVGELANTLTSWGDKGIGFINHDFTMVLSRNPSSAEIGIEADNHSSVGGLAAGAATMYDRDGSFGVCVVSAVARGAAALDVSAAKDNWADTHRGSANSLSGSSDRHEAVK
ncbi:acyl-CoA thioesterase domain-containing protein [Nocardia sp. NPDC088792]|uniref:acyl-CoA thioesterase domain-containing protein n=1 Tax=Nocardia sp. NPDC088792 TaxID=3364332 RepID=UPI003800C9B5